MGRNCKPKQVEGYDGSFDWFYIPKNSFLENRETTISVNDIIIIKTKLLGLKLIIFEMWAKACKNV